MKNLEYWALVSAATFLALGVVAGRSQPETPEPTHMERLREDEDEALTARAEATPIHWSHVPVSHRLVFTAIHTADCGWVVEAQTQNRGSPYCVTQASHSVDRALAACLDLLD